jgi:hypothetical protein
LGGEINVTHKEKWTKYLSERKATYEFRARTRYRGVFDALLSLGLQDGHSILDAGAGDCQFGRYLFERGWRGQYKPIDATISGEDLDYWDPDRKSAGFLVAIEVAEHLYNPIRFIHRLQDAAITGVVITTPNCRVVDVLACDETHVSVITQPQLEHLGFEVSTASWFSEQHNPGQQDTLIGAWKRVL